VLVVNFPVALPWAAENAVARPAPADDGLRRPPRPDLHVLPGPAKQLRGFQRITLGPGETRTVALRLAAADLAYWDVARHAWAVAPGRVELMVGPSSADGALGLRRTVSVTR